MIKLIKAAYILRYYGLKMFIKRGYTYFVNLTLRHQPEEYRIIFEAIVPSFGRNGVMIDVGAGLGSALEQFAKQGWRCYAFEPNPINKKFLVKFMQQYPNVRIDDRAVSLESQQNVIFYTSADSFGIGSLVPFLNSHRATMLINTISLKDYFIEQDIPWVNFLKIDAEGSDYSVLQGFPWEIYLPDVIQCEFDEKKFGIPGYSWKDMVKFLVERKYKILVSEWEPVQRYGGVHRWRTLHEYPDIRINQHGWGNIIAVRSDNLLTSIKSNFSRFISSQHSV